MIVADSNGLASNRWAPFWNPAGRRREDVTGAVEYGDRPWRPQPGERTRRGAPERFVGEGIKRLGPKEDYSVFVDGECLGLLLRRHFGADPKIGYTSLGRLRVTVKRVGDLAT